MISSSNHYLMTLMTNNSLKLIHTYPKLKGSLPLITSYATLVQRLTLIQNMVMVYCRRPWG